MRYFALASDYDGTLATRGRLEPATIAALERCRASGRRVLLVTGREVADLASVCPRLDLFTAVVAENGALLYDPATGEGRLLGEPAPPALVAALRALDVTPLSVGRVVVATREPHDGAVLRAIRELGLEHEVIFNKGAVMVLPSGINKATGLTAVLTELGLSARNVVAVGDAENDHAFLSACECGVAVANALPALKQRADHVTTHDHGAGVVELIDALVADDLRRIDAGIRRHDVAIGSGPDGQPVMVSPPRVTGLIAGAGPLEPARLGEWVLEALVDRGYQCCVIDASGSYGGRRGAVMIGGPSSVPTVSEMCAALSSPAGHCIVNLGGVASAERPAEFGRLWLALEEMRARVGRPHWVLVADAEQLVPRGGSRPPVGGPWAGEGGVMLVTSQVSGVARAALAAVDIVLAVGGAADRTIADVASSVGSGPPDTAAGLSAGLGGLIWYRRLRPEVGAASVVGFRPSSRDRAPSSAIEGGSPTSVRHRA